MRILVIFLIVASSCSIKSPDFDIYHSKTYVFNLTGRFHGNGDVVAPLWAAMRFKKSKLDINCILLVDDAAVNIIKQTTGIDDEAKFKTTYGCQMIHEQQEGQIPIADVSFEMFVGGRKIKDFYDTKYNNKNTIVIVSDTMHGEHLDSVRVHGFQFYFMPPGIGGERSGGIDDPNIDALLGPLPLDQIGIARMYLEGKPKIRDLVRRDSSESARDYLLGFAYGIHNEAHPEFPELRGQTQAFLDELRRQYQNKTILVLTPNKVENLKTVIRDHSAILELDHIVDVNQLEKRPYLVTVPYLTSKEFLALLAVSDVPVLVEGDNSIAQAMKLDKDFLVLKSGWNAPAIRSLIDFDRTHLYEYVYDFNGFHLPNWGAYFSQGFLTNNYQLPDFVKKLEIVIRLAKVIRAQGERADFQSLSEGAFWDTHDRYLQYSILLAADQAGYLEPEVLKQLKKSLQNQGIDWQKMQDRMFMRAPPHKR